MMEMLYNILSPGLVAMIRFQSFLKIEPGLNFRLQNGLWRLFGWWSPVPVLRQEMMGEAVDSQVQQCPMSSDQNTGFILDVFICPVLEEFVVAGVDNEEVRLIFEQLLHYGDKAIAGV